MSIRARLLALSLALASVAATAATATPAVAQPLPDTTGLAEAVGRARFALREVPRLWGFDAAAVEWILTDGRTHLASGRRDGRETLTPVTLPVGTTIANTSVTLDGRRWAMVMLPLGGDPRARVSLLVHEAMHTFQPERLPRPGRTEAGIGGDFLDGEHGRTWLFLELRAISAALRTTGEARLEAARDALRFRAVRDSLAPPAERERLDALDLAEGIPEYTGWRLSGASDSLLAARLAARDTARVSWVRGIAYWTGPAYGYLLDALAADGWRARQREGTRLPALLATAVGPDGAPVDPMVRATRYDGPALARAEHARAERNARRLDSLRARFVEGPVLRLVPRSMQVSFDPNGQTPLGDAGVVMMNFRWAASDGAELVAAGGALVSPRWDQVQVPLGGVALPEGTLTSARTVEGEGWRLTLPIGWRVRRVDGLLEVRPPQ